LKVLRGPTIVKFWESFVHSQKIYIVMEFATQGALSSQIAKKAMSGNKYVATTILEYVAQITLAIMIMHAKNILHRDIKT
jgi:serine/threonine protein kinase